METKDLLFALIRSEFKGTEIDNEIKDSISMDTLTELYSLSATHDIAHLLGESLSKVELLTDDKVSEAFRKATLMAFHRYERSRYELNRICEALNNAEISFIPLKGAIIREYYPEPWLRTSCDIDVLVHEEDLEKAVFVLMNEHKYVTDGMKNYHDISLHSPSGVHLELHFNIKEDIESLDRGLTKVWQYATASKDMKYKYEMKNEFLLFHIVAHLSYHFITGGCGIRPIIDLWLLGNVLCIDENVLNELLSGSNLLMFYKNLKNLSAVWLDSVQHTDLTKQMENYILRGGVYGSLQNKVLLQQQKKNGKFAYSISRIFSPYSKIKQLYPIITKHPWLTPFMQICRLFMILIDGRFKRSIKELSYNKNISKSEAEEMRDFLEEIGL